MQARVGASTANGTLKRAVIHKRKDAGFNTAFQEPLAIVISLKEDRRTYQELDLQNLHLDEA